MQVTSQDHVVDFSAIGVEINGNKKKNNHLHTLTGGELTLHLKEKR